ncbi:MAG TPA: metal-dependent transcriptional regulator [Desulfosalsimonadaceae bacterium]|nr:metal-dependent transcriptional regulator [Desulfosalsimonadaceae bacterium]
MGNSNKQPVAEKPLTPVMEDYLEAIFDLAREKKVVRVKDIAKRLDVKMPTVTSMLKTLGKRGLVHYEKYEYVELTGEGLTIGREMRRRHSILFQFLTDILKIDEQMADGEACKMEHTLSETTLESLTDFMAFIQECPRAGEDWLKNFAEYRIHGYKPEKCRERSDHFACELKSRADSGKDGKPPGKK